MSQFVRPVRKRARGAGEPKGGLAGFTRIGVRHEGQSSMGICVREVGGLEKQGSLSLEKMGKIQVRCWWLIVRKSGHTLVRIT